jgi:protein TonB
MFDKLIESNSEEAEFKNRRSYFMVSSVVVGVLFLAAVVASIYAGDFGIGNGDLDLSDLMAPVEMAAVEPEQPQPRTTQPQNQQNSETTTRQANILRIEENPTSVPPVSVTPNTQASRPTGRFDIALVDSGPSTSVGTGRDTTGSASDTTGLTPSRTSQVNEDPGDSTPPPAIAPPRQKSLGVVNGMAASLPKPIYPAAAVALRLEGKVDVQVTIDESGKVISAKAASGHPLLRPAAEKAAWNARFTPTTLSKVPVKVTGVIVYNFTRN